MTTILVLSFHSCYFLPIWESFESIDVRNNSNDTILVYLATGNSPATPTIYPDTCLPAEAYVGDIRIPHTNDSISGYLVRVDPHDGASVLTGMVRTDYWQHGFRKKFFEQNHINVLSFFFIHSDTLKKYGYDYIAQKNLILARYDLNKSNLDALDLKVPYPPTPKMKNMKKWIP